MITDGLLRLKAATPTGPALEMMRLSLLDWAACGIAGAAEPVAEVLRGQAGPGEATIIGGGTAGWAEAALLNGATSHALDYDDTHFAHIGHPSVAVIPAALAVAEKTSAALDAIVEAALIGVEASIRTGIWLGRGHYQVGFHQTATAGAFGATLAAARLLGLDDTQSRHALGLAATMASGLKGQFGTMGKPLNAGLAARTGVEAALWARAGMTSADNGLAGPQGFGPTHHGASDETALDGLGEVWLFETISHKFHACCHGLHATLEALATRKPGSVHSVQVHTHPRWLTVCNIDAPRTGLECKFSYRQVVAMALWGDDTSAIDSYSQDCADDPAMTTLRDLVTVTADDTLTEMQARVLVNGREELFHDLAAPIPLDTRRTKLHAKARGLVGDRADALIAACAGGDLAALSAQLKG